MTNQEVRILHRKIEEGVRVAVAQALDRHRRLGESIAVWQDNQVVILPSEQIPSMESLLEAKEEVQRNLSK
jgi:hypothetical protein